MTDRITLEDIDFDVVETCTDAKVISRYIELLKADGGYFQELLKACELKLQQLDPKAALKFSQLQPEDVAASRSLLLQWENELRSAAAPEKAVENLPPVRNTKFSVTKTATQPSDNRKQNAPDAWDEFDLEDEDERKRTADLKRQQDEYTVVYPVVDTPDIKDPKAEILKGLEALKAAEAAEAEYFFSRAIHGDKKLAKAFFHRAEARAALEKYAEALEDVQTALLLDPSIANAGGFAMRANLRAEAGLLDDAEKDFLKALEGAKGNAGSVEKLEKQLRTLRGKMEDLKRKSKPEKFTKISIVEVDDDDEPKIVELPDEPKIVELPDEPEIAKSESFRKISIIEETVEAPVRKRVPVQIVDE